MREGPDREAPSNLRGWLSEVYVTALLAGQSEHLARRLGDRATVDDPIFGRASGMPALQRYLREMGDWLGKHQASFEKVGFTQGSDRDVTEGTLTLTFEGRRVSVPLAIVAERRKEREVELRLYYSTGPIRGTHTVRAPLLPQNDEVAVPPPVAAHLEALARGDLEAIVESFQPGGFVRDSSGATHARSDAGGALRAFYEKLLRGHDGRTPSDRAAGAAGIEILKGARADDGRTCALEYTVVRLHGKSVPPQAGLAVYERAESGLLGALRVYEDVDV
jgi:hypothetical protein